MSAGSIQHISSEVMVPTVTLQQHSMSRAVSL